MTNAMCPQGSLGEKEELKHRRVHVYFHNGSKVPPPRYFKQNETRSTNRVIATQTTKCLCQRQNSVNLNPKQRQQLDGQAYM